MAAPPPTSVEFEFESPFVVEFLLPGPGSAVVWNVLEHPWHVGLELAVSSTVILPGGTKRLGSKSQRCEEREEKPLLTQFDMS